MPGLFVYRLLQLLCISSILNVYSCGEKMRKINFQKLFGAPVRLVQKFLHLGRKKKLIVLVVLILVLGAVAAGVTFVMKEKDDKKQATVSEKYDKVNCIEKTIDGYRLLSVYKTKEAYETISSYEEECGRMPTQAEIKDASKVDFTVQRMRYILQLAQVYYLDGNKDKATEYAKRVIEIQNAMPTELAQKQTDFASMYDVSDQIIKDSYTGYKRFSKDVPKYENN